MVSARRKLILHTLGVDLYERRPVSRVAPVEPVVTPPMEQTPGRPAEERLAPTIVEPQVAETRAVYAGQAATLAWWQFEDLLLLEELPEGQQPSHDLHRLAMAIAAALGRGNGPRGELHWPPGGDFSVIPLDEFLHHFIAGRAEEQAALQLIVTGERIAGALEKTGPISIPSLQTLLAEPQRKAEAWAQLKPLRR